MNLKRWIIPAVLLCVKPAGDMKAFIDWATGADGQGIVTKVGYFPVK